jgi:hypothetical protein
VGPLLLVLLLLLLGLCQEATWLVLLNASTPMVRPLTQHCP